MHTGKDFRDKPPLIFGLQRSGTTPIYLALESYYQQTRGIEGLMEYLNFYTHDVRSTNGAICKIPWNSAPTFPGPREYRQELSRRVQLLVNAPKSYSLKALVNQLYPEMFLTLSRTHHIVAVQRKSLADNVLSYLISEHLKLWYRSGGLQVPERSIPFNESHFLRFTEQYEAYRKLLEVFPPDTTIVYEDFSNALNKHKIKDYLASLGYTQPWDPELCSFTDIQNPSDKLRLFKDPRTTENTLKRWLKSLSQHSY